MKNLYSLCVAALSLFAVSCSSSGDNVVVYQAPEGEVLNAKYKVTADGIDVPVYDIRVGPEDARRRNLAMDDKANSGDYYDIAGMAYFDLKKGPVTVTVTVEEDIKEAKILPTSYGITPEINGKTLSFTVDKPQNLTVDINGDYVRSLHIFVNPEEKDAPDPKDPNVVYFGPGIWNVSAMEIEDGMTVYVAGGAIVRGYVGPHEEFTISGYSGQKNYKNWYMFGLKGNNITFRGRGIIDATDLPTHARRTVLVGGNDIKMEGVIIRNSSEWTVQVDNANRVTIDNIKLLGHRANSDGIDICASNDVLVENCFIRTLDDLIVVKTLKNSQGEASRIVARKCVLWNEVAHALSVGAEITQKVEDVLFEDCDIIHDHCREWSLRVYQTDSGLVKNVRFENIRIEQAVKFASLWINEAFWTSDAKRGHIQDVVFKNITVNSPDPLVKGMEFLGYDKEHAITNVLVDNVVVNGKPVTMDDIVKNDYVYDVTVK